MNESSKTPLVIAFVVVVVLFLIFGGGAMTGSMMSGGMMGHGWIGGTNKRENLSPFWLKTFHEVKLTIPYHCLFPFKTDTVLPTVTSLDISL